MRPINKLIVHCTATSNNRKVTVDQIRDWHVKGNGWSDIGYHYVIYRDGSIHNGRHVRETGAHCKGHNSDSIGVCLVGNDQFTAGQFDSLKELYMVLKNIFGSLEPFGHRDFTNKKTCPNFEVKEILTF